MKKEYKNKLTGLELTASEYMNVDREVQSDFEYIGTTSRGYEFIPRPSAVRVTSSRRAGHVVQPLTNGDIDMWGAANTAIAVDPYVGSTVQNEDEEAPLVDWSIRLSSLRAINSNPELTVEQGILMLRNLDSRFTLINDIEDEQEASL